MAWAFIWLFGVFSLLASRRLNASTLVTIIFVATIFIVDIPLFPGLNTLRLSLMLALFLIVSVPMRLNGYYTAFLGVLSAYVFILSLTAVGLEIPSHWDSIDLGFFQTPLIRNILTTFIFVLSALTFLVSYNAVNPSFVMQRTIQSFLIIATFAAFFALVQITTNIFTTALNPFFELFSKAIILEKTGFIRLRPSVFVYEPRYFGAAMGFALFLVLLNDKRHFFSISSNKHYSLILLFGAMILFSASSTAVLSIVLGFLVCYIGILKTRGSLLRFVIFVMIMAVLFATVKSFDLLIFNRFELYLHRIQYYGVTGDQLAPLAVLAYIDWLKNLPFTDLLFGKGLGYSSFFANEYISTSSVLFDKGFFSSRINLLDMIGDLGVIGLLLLHSIWILLLANLQTRMLSAERGSILRRMKLLCLFFIGVNLSYVCYTLIWLSLGLCYNFYSAERRVDSIKHTRKAVY